MEVKSAEDRMIDAITDSIQECFEDYDDQFDHEYEKNYVPYGNTQVVESEYPTENSQLRCSEAFNQDFDIYDFVENYLLQNKKFLEAINDYISFHY